MVGLAFGVAAAANFPVLILSMYWKGLTTRGALVGGYGGLVSAVIFVLLSKSVWVTVLGNPTADLPVRPAGPLRDADRLLPGLVGLEGRRLGARAGRSRWRSRTSTCGPRPASAPPAPASTDPGEAPPGLRPQIRWW